MIASLICLVLGMLFTFGGGAVLAFDFYLTFDKGLKLLPVYDMLLMVMGAQSMIDMQTWVQQTFGLEMWRDRLKPMLIMLPACVLIGLPGIVFLFIGIKMLPKAAKSSGHHMSTTEVLHQAQMRAGDRRF